MAEALVASHQVGPNPVPLNDADADRGRPVFSIPSEVAVQIEARDRELRLKHAVSPRRRDALAALGGRIGGGERRDRGGTCGQGGTRSWRIAQAAADGLARTADASGASAESDGSGCPQDCRRCSPRPCSPKVRYEHGFGGRGRERPHRFCGRTRGAMRPKPSAEAAPRSLVREMARKARRAGINLRKWKGTQVFSCGKASSLMLDSGDRNC